MKGFEYMKKRFLAIVAAVSMFVGSINAFAEYEMSEEYNVFEQVAGYISTYYIDDKLTDYDIMLRGISELLKDDDEKLIELLKSTLSALDPYSEFFTAEEYQGFVNNINKTFYGIGVSIVQKGDYVVIEGFTAGSGAQAAGIMTGDKISKVNGESMKGKTTNDIRNAVAGELGTEVEVSVLRNDKEYTYKVIRGKVTEDTVSYTKLSDDVAYISIIDMSNHTADEFADALKSADNDKITNIILDLRDNVGGYLDCATDIGEMIIPEGIIVDTKYRQPFMNKTYYSSLKETKYKFNVLVNEYTASAAEILAGAIQDSGIGKLVGEKTFGKGVIQQTFPLSNGAVFKLTVGHYLTRNGHAINEIGLSPDEHVTNVTEPIDTGKYTPFTYKTKWHPGADDDNITAAKERLYLLRYYNGEINNNFDEGLVNAVKKFQEENNLYSYGVLDITTQTKIENEFAKLEVLSDKQLDMAYKMFTGKELNQD